MALLLYDADFAMRIIVIQASGFHLEVPENEHITVEFSTTLGKFKITGPIDLVFSAASEAFRK